MNQIIVYDLTNQMSRMYKMQYFTDETLIKLSYILIGYFIGFIVSNISFYRLDVKDELNHSNVRDMIDNMFKQTKNDKDFISLNSIYKKMYKHNNQITKGLIRSALKYDPPYSIGFHKRKMGYRNIKQI